MSKYKKQLKEGSKIIKEKFLKEKDFNEEEREYWNRFALSYHSFIQIKRITAMRKDKSTYQFLTYWDRPPKVIDL